MAPQNQTLCDALRGISGILITPFDSTDEINPYLLQPVIDRAVRAGVHLLVANGNTSEFYALDANESERMVHATVELVAGRVPLLSGVGKNIKDACHLARVSSTAGASGLMVHQPPDPFVAPRGVLDYVRRIAEASDGLPMVLYLRDDGIGLDVIEMLARLPGVVGIKWACPTPLRLGTMIDRTRDKNLAWVGGLAESWAPAFYAVGSRGFTSGLINVMPSHSVAIHAALQNANYQEATRLINVMAEFEELRTEERNGTNVTVVKTALQLIGNDCGHVRPPGAWPLTSAARDKLALVLQRTSV